jgi:RHS repeat-associated protein
MFTGRKYDSETELYYYRERYYKLSIGRFIQTDPVGYSAGINWYMYCGNNPIVLVDQFGLCQDYYRSRVNFWEAVGWTAGCFPSGEVAQV